MSDHQIEQLRHEVQRLLAAALGAGEAHAAELSERDAQHSAELRRRDTEHTTELHQRDDSHETELHDRDDRHHAELARRDDVHAADMARQAMVHVDELAAREASFQIERDDFQRALESRDVIGQAKGIIMVSLGCSAEAAFDLLKAQSQAENRKLVEIARELAARTQRTMSGK